MTDYQSPGPWQSMQFVFVARPKDKLFYAVHYRLTKEGTTVFRSRELETLRFQGKTMSEKRLAKFARRKLEETRCLLPGEPATYEVVYQ
jgi:hypothetical protein